MAVALRRNFAANKARRENGRPHREDEQHGRSEDEEELVGEIGDGCARPLAARPLRLLETLHLRFAELTTSDLVAHVEIDAPALVRQ